MLYFTRTVTVFLLLMTPMVAMAQTPAPANKPVKLAVLLVFDQFRGDYPLRWKAQFGPDGLNRFLDKGAWYANAHYPYALTVTGAGHASLVAGASPSVHGIISNDWHNPVNGEEVYCATAERYQRVPAAPVVEQKPSVTGAVVKKRSGSGSPERLLAPTLGDSLRPKSDSPSKIASFSLKDRGAILPGGIHGNIIYWWDSETGEFVTSNYYRDSVAGWVSEFNAGKPANRWFGTTWERLRPDLDYNQLAGPDDAPGEGTGTLKKQGRAFPHPFPSEKATPDKSYYSALYNSPFSNELLADFAMEAVRREKLGQRDVSDLLCISFSANDVVGHTWGPDSHEVLDITLRTDLLLARIFKDLDSLVGKDNYAVVLSADHGVCPLPERARTRGEMTAMRVDAVKLSLGLVSHLRKTFKLDEKAKPLINTLDENLYLNAKVFAAAGTTVEVAREEAARWLRTQEGIGRVFTRDQLGSTAATDDGLLRQARLSFHRASSGDLVVLPAYGCLFGASPTATGTSHGTPYHYDTHVPLLVYGPGVKTGRRDQRVSCLASSAILADFLKVPAPPAAEPVPSDLK